MVFSVSQVFSSIQFSPHPLFYCTTLSISCSKFQRRNCTSLYCNLQKSKTYQNYQTNEEDQDTENSSLPKKGKKKKKLRPGFYDQTHERWSLKISSDRVKLPWEQGEGEETLGKTLYPFDDVVPSKSFEEIKESQRPEISANFVQCNPMVSSSGVRDRTPEISYLDSDTTMNKFYEQSDEVKSNVGSIMEKLRVFDIETSDVDVKTSSNNENFFHPEFQSYSNFSTTKRGKQKSDVKISGLLYDPSDIKEEQRYSHLEENDDIIDGPGENDDPIKLPWEMERNKKAERWERNTEIAERTIPEPELRRLRNVALRMKERIKIGVAGITEDLVQTVHEKWKENEVVKFKIEGPLSVNMKRAHEVLERKTGGLVIWRSGSSLVLFRGMAYKFPCVHSYSRYIQTKQTSCSNKRYSSIDITRNTEGNDSLYTHSDSSTSFQEDNDVDDINSILDPLGPRFKGWSGVEPCPVDADLLPCVVPGFKPPFRLLPYGIRNCLGNKQMTSLRNHARKMPPHFALGRNRELQGLAKAMVRLWERSAIAKIAIKRGVQNTCNERMAEELKKLTGGTLVSRNKDYIVFYRGNDFLSPTVTRILSERQELSNLLEAEEEQARMRASAFVSSLGKIPRGPFIAGTLVETEEAKSRWGNPPNSEERQKMLRESQLSKHASLVRSLERKLALANLKVKKAEKALAKVQTFLEPAELPTDLETITDEERFLFRKMGLSMKPFLSLGRRGIFDGTVENMHLHWKYRDLVKIIVKGENFAQVKHIAISLEAESGGILVSLDKTTKGYAIIVYRGKNYARPKTIRPKNLLTKRQALARSIELQRREALHHYISDLKGKIDALKTELKQMEATQETTNGSSYAQINDAYSSDEDREEEGEEAYLETYNMGEEDEDEDDELEKLMDENEIQ